MLKKKKVQWGQKNKLNLKGKQDFDPCTSCLKHKFT